MIYVEVEGLKEGVDSIAEKLLDYALDYMQSTASRNAPIKTGRLAQSIYKKKTGKFTGEVVSPAEYSGFLEYGTPSHMIRPVNKKALYWEQDGTGRFAKAVRHPGIEVGTPESPRILPSGATLPFMRPAVYSFLSHANSMTADDWNVELG